MFTAREISMHRAERPLGLHFIKCGNPACGSRDRPGHIIGEIRDSSSARIRCKACKWKSKNVRLDKNLFITRLHKTKAPLLFYHTFPSPTGLTSMFLWTFRPPHITCISWTWLTGTVPILFHQNCFVIFHSPRWEQISAGKLELRFQRNYSHSLVIEALKWS